MTQPTATYDSYDTVGNREDLTDVIFNISPTKTPYLTKAAKLKAKATNHEWQTDALAAADGDNKVIEGDEATMDASTATTRLGNYCQISDKTATVSGTTEAIDRAGRDGEMDYQMAKKSKELKRDMETRLVGNFASAAGSSSVARETAGVHAWLTTNDSRGAGGSQGGFSAGTVAAATNGTQRAFTEALLKNVLKLAWDASGDAPDMLLMNSFQKQVFSGFTGNANKEIDAKNKKLVAAVDIYESDFGVHEAYLDNFMPTRSVLALNMEYWGVAYLRSFRSWELAKTGDTEKKQLLVEYCNVSKNEAASGVIADLLDS